MTSLTDEVRYYFVLTAENADGESDFSEEVDAVPSTLSGVLSAPTITSASGVKINGNSCIKVKWISVYGAASYTVYWSTSPGVTTGSTTKNEGELSPSINAVFESGTTYYFIVTAKNSGNESPASAEISAVAP